MKIWIHTKILAHTSHIEALHLFIDWLQTKDLNQCSVPWSWPCVVYSTECCYWPIWYQCICYTVDKLLMIDCNHTSFEWTRAVRLIYGIICHMQGLYWSFVYVTYQSRFANSLYHFEPQYHALNFDLFLPLTCFLPLTNLLLLFWLISASKK